MRRNAISLLMLCMSCCMQAQNLPDVQRQSSPLVLQAQGSFYVGGESEQQTREELGGICPEGHVTVNQMYVRYMVPQSVAGNASFVLIHGMHLTGKCWETTPDGRMGWDEYLVRNGCPVYVVDQVGIGRSGFNQKKHNAAKYGKASATEQSAFSRKTDENSWMNFRFGTKDGKAVDDLSIKAGKGKVFGMLGANGAGKSTIIECMLGTKTADSGSVSILGCDPKKDRRTLFQKVGVQFLANLEENFNVPTFPIEANDFIFL